MWMRRAALALIVASGAAQAQSLNEGSSRLEACFERSRAADAICARLPYDSEHRIGCFTKSRALQLECMDRVLSEVSAKAQEAPPETALGAPPAVVPPPELPSEGKTPNESAPAVAVLRDPSIVSATQSDAVPKVAFGKLPSVSEPAGGSMRGDVDKEDDQAKGAPSWVLSETTSPVDFTPLVAAVIRSVSGPKDGPNTLAVRCRSGRTEVSLKSDGVWSARRGNNLGVDYQVNDQKIVRRQWALSADGRTASYKGDPVEFMQSMPDGAMLTVAVADQENGHNEAVFRLTGLFEIRRRVAAACGWTPVSAKISLKSDNARPAPISRRLVKD